LVERFIRVRREELTMSVAVTERTTFVVWVVTIVAAE